MTKRRTLCEKSDVLIFSVTYVDVVVLPKLQTLLFGQIHLIVGFYAEGVIPRIDVGQCAVDTPSAERVGVALGAASYLLVCYVACPHSRVGEEETLCGCETVDSLKFLAAGGVDKCVVCHLQSAVVGNVFAECQCAEIGRASCRERV